MMVFGFFPSPVIFCFRYNNENLDLLARIQWLRFNFNSAEKLMKPRKNKAKSGLSAAIAAMDFDIGFSLGSMAAATQ